MGLYRSGGKPRRGTRRAERHSDGCLFYVFLGLVVIAMVAWIYFSNRK